MPRLRSIQSSKKARLHGGNGEDIGGAGGQRAPDQDRHPVDRHARRAQAQERHHEIDRAHGGGDAQQDHPQRIHVDVGAVVIGARRQRHIIEPAGIGPEADGEGGIEKDAGAEIDPIGQRIQPRQRHVARAQQQRPEIIAKARQHRPGIKKDHGHAMHGEELVILFRRQQMQVRPGELQAEDQRLDPARDQEGESGDDVAKADFLVIHLASQPIKPGSVSQSRVQPCGQRGRFGRRRTGGVHRR